MNSIQMIKELTCAFGAPGFEDDVLDVAKKYIPSGYSAERDSMLNFYIEREKTSALPTVLLDAHSDEVGLIVKAVKDDGTLVIAPLGEWVPAALYAQRMLVKNLDGKLITVVIASKMPHFDGDIEEPPGIDKMVVDVGASSKEETVNEFRITQGCPIVPKAEFEQFGDIMFAKALDDRLGCAAVIDVLAKIKDMPLDVNVAGVLTSQEEIGLRGAKVAANRVKPRVAICFEGAPADDTLVEPYMVQTALKKGPMLRHMDISMIANPRFTRFALDIAKKHGIPVQEAVRTRGGTNAASFQMSNLGIPTIVLACPVRYSHSNNGVASVSDYEKTVELTVEIVKALNEEIIRDF